ncbi:MAG: GNAT family N-acetyltransferase [Paraclostridium sp.]
MIKQVKLSKVNGVLTNNLYADFHFLNEENFSDVLKLYNIVVDSMDNKNWLKIRDFKSLQKTLDDGGFIIGCYLGSKLIACALCDVPNINDIDLLVELDIDSSDIKNTYISGFVMVHPSYRGNSLQSELLDLRIDASIDRGKKYIITVSAVDNVYSLNNIKSRGFELKSQKTNDLGVLRNVFVKDLCKNNIDEITITA